MCEFVRTTDNFYNKISLDDESKYPIGKYIELGIQKR